MQTSNDNPFTSAALAEWRPDRRALLEDAVAALIAFLDNLDGDADLEPTLSWTDREAAAGLYGVHDDRERDGGDEPEGDYFGDSGLSNPAWEAAQPHRPVKRIRRAA